MTVRQIIYAAARKTLILRTGQTMNSDMEADFKTTLDNMFDSWNAQRLLIPVQERAEFALVNGQVYYTMGSTGVPDFNYPRPPRIEYAGWVQNAGTAQQFEQRIPIWSDQQWANVSNKLQTGQFPMGIYPQYNWPLVYVYVWPIMAGVQSSTKLALYFWKILSAFGGVASSTDYTFQPAYMKAIIDNLAFEAWPIVVLNNKGGAPVSQYQILEKDAKQSMGLIKSLNVVDIQMGCSPALNNEGLRNYNIFSDTFGNRSY